MAPHKNPIGSFAFGGGGKEIRPLVMLSQYSTDFVVAIAPKRTEKSREREREKQRQKEI